MQKILIITLFNLFVITGLSACGQTGPLYLPDNPPPKSTTTGH